MAKRKNVKYTTKSKLSSLFLILTILLVIFGRFTDKYDETPLTSPENVKVPEGIITVHVIDVGQGSSTLIQSGHEGILVDGGEKRYGKELVTYISKTGVKKLKYVVASHPHTDHIGGLLTVLDGFEVENVIMPKLSSANIPTTKTYENLLLKIKEKNIKAIAATYGARYMMGDALMEIYSPVKQYDDLNNMSVVCRVKANCATFLLPGDASIGELTDMYYKGTDFSSDILVAAHHGSSESLHKKFYYNVNPDVVVYSCGEDNSYGHPHKEGVDFFGKMGCKIYRTDKNGNIVFTCNSDGYKVKTDY